MSEEKFNLSEKIENMQEGFEGCHTCDIKEFIRRLLDTYEGMDENWIQKSTIIKLAGNKLA